MARANSGGSNGASARGLRSLTRQSRAVEPMSVGDRREREREAQSRNCAEGPTGFTVYDQRFIFRGLEGPADSRSRVWASASRDERHTNIGGLHANIEEVALPETSSCAFAGWHMPVAVRESTLPAATALPTPALALVSALEPLVPLRDGEPPAVWGSGATAAPVPVIPILPVLVEAVVVPQLLSKHGSVRRFLPPVSKAAIRLARLLLTDDQKPAAKMLRAHHARVGSLAPLCATLIEPAARGLGDLWLADDCSQVDMTLALCRLHRLVLQLTAGAAPAAVGLPSVLVAPQPGEPHLLGAALDADLLWEAGWDTHREFPETDVALQNMLADTWFDVLDLSLSLAIQRRDWFPRMTETIAGARAASRNPALTVLVGGRAFFEQCEASTAVGADASSASALQVVLAATNALEKTLTKVAERTALVTSS